MLEIKSFWKLHSYILYTKQNMERVDTYKGRALIKDTEE
jgi:hypothetical protein